MKRGNSGIVFRANSGWTAKMGKGGRGGKRRRDKVVSTGSRVHQNKLRVSCPRPKPPRLLTGSFAVTELRPCFIVLGDRRKFTDPVHRRFPIRFRSRVPRILEKTHLES